MAKTNSGLVAYAKAQVGLPYWYGTFGNKATVNLLNQKKKQYPSQYTASDFNSQIGKRVHDCVGLIKGYIWSDTTTSTPKYNLSQDKSASGMYAVSSVKGTIATLPSLEGVLVYKASKAGDPKTIHHVGVYDGSRYIYEAKGHAWGVVKTDINVDKTWTHWSKCPYIEYTASNVSRYPNKNEEDRLSFIKAVSVCAQNSYKKLGKVKPSVCIGMACLESGYGSSYKMDSHNAYLGQKVGTGKTATDYWSGKYYTTKTSEEYTVGVHTQITDNFRAYNDMQQCTDNYYELLNEGKSYTVVKAEADYETQMKQIKQAGYMTSSTEVDKVLTIIKKYNLTQYDKICKTTEIKTFYPKYTGNSTSIVAALKAVGEKDTSLDHRKRIGVANGIPGVGTVDGNTMMLNLLKAGKLIKV